MRVLVLANFDVGLYNFRKELLQTFLDKGFEVFISLPQGERVSDLVDMGCVFIETAVNRRGTNIKEDLGLIKKYRQIMKEICPDVVLSYTIKPNVYGGMAAASLKIPYIANVTGLGTSIENKGILPILTKLLYKIGLRKSSCVFFQNSTNRAFFINNKIVRGKHRLIPGSGVNLNQFKVLEYPEGDSVDFVFISRVMKDKGIDHYLEAAEAIKTKYPNTNFHICGFCEESYEEILKQKHNAGVVVCHGMVSDIKGILRDVHCIVLPTYHEGMSNVLQEASASGRPCLCSDIPGCREIVNDGETGFLFESKSTQSLIDAMERFLALSYEEHKRMGLNAREKVEKEFSRQIIIDAYMEEINKITEAVK